MIDLEFEPPLLRVGAEALVLGTARPDVEVVVDQDCVLLGAGSVEGHGYVRRLSGLGPIEDRIREPEYLRLGQNAEGPILCMPSESARRYQSDQFGITSAWTRSL